MTVDEARYRRLKDAGFSHQAALALADDAENEYGIEGGGLAARVAALEGLAARVAALEDGGGGGGGLAVVAGDDLPLGLAAYRWASTAGTAATALEALAPNDAWTVDGDNLVAAETGLWLMHCSALIDNLDAADVGNGVTTFSITVDSYRQAVMNVDRSDVPAASSIGPVEHGIVVATEPGSTVVFGATGEVLTASSLTVSVVIYPLATTITAAPEIPTLAFRTASLGESIAYDETSDDLYAPEGDYAYVVNPDGPPDQVRVFVLVDGLVEGNAYEVSNSDLLTRFLVITANDESVVSLEDAPLGGVMLVDAGSPLDDTAAQGQISMYADAGIILQPIGWGVTFSPSTPPFTITEASEIPTFAVGSPVTDGFPLRSEGTAYFEELASPTSKFAGLMGLTAGQQYVLGESGAALVAFFVVTSNDGSMIPGSTVGSYGYSLFGWLDQPVAFVPANAADEMSQLAGLGVEVELVAYGVWWDASAVTTPFTITAAP